MSKLRVLIVEDEMIIAWDLRLTLEGLGCEVVSTETTAKGAVEAAQKKEPELILMDILLKGRETGIDAAREIRLFSEVPIVFLTGNTDLADAGVIERNRIQGLYGKPPSREKLERLIRRCRDNRETVRS
jgi:CheY-like chemotaxis protein